MRVGARRRRCVGPGLWGSSRTRGVRPTCPARTRDTSRPAAFGGGSNLRTGSQARESRAGGSHSGACAGSGSWRAGQRASYRREDPESRSMGRRTAATARCGPVPTPVWRHLCPRVEFGGRGLRRRGFAAAPTVAVRRPECDPRRPIPPHRRRQPGLPDVERKRQVRYELRWEFCLRTQIRPVFYNR